MEAWGYINFVSIRVAMIENEREREREKERERETTLLRIPVASLLVVKIEPLIEELAPLTNPTHMRMKGPFSLTV